MTAYNSERYIDQAIESVVSQTFQNWELVIVEDGSTDGTKAKIQAWMEKDTRIRLFCNDKNLGIGATRQRGLEQARGEYAAVLDSDDVALPEWLQRRADYLDEHPETVLVSGSRIVIDEHGKFIRVNHEKDQPEVLRWRLLFGNSVSQPSCMFRISEALGVGGYALIPYLEDWDLFARLAERSRIGQLDTALIMYRVHGTNSSGLIGSDRERLEPIASQIMKRNVASITGVRIPDNLVWYLFRGRHAFRGNKVHGREALGLLLRVFKTFSVGREFRGHRRLLAEALLDDVANTLRCGGWNVWQILRAMGSIANFAGLRAFLSLTFLRSVVKISSLPLRTFRFRPI